MGKLEIKIYPDNILRKKARSIKKVGKEEQALAYNMIETMRYANGMGLAAPQVGKSERIIVVEDTEERDSALALINPRILKRRGRSTFCEGCLSVPEITSDIVRPEEVTVEGIDLGGRKVTIDAKGVLARVLQHEIDHLDGILFIDRIGFLKRKKIMKNVSSKKVCMEL